LSYSPVNDPRVITQRFSRAGAEWRNHPKITGISLVCRISSVNNILSQIVQVHLALIDGNLSFGIK
jgi:hypothetical protein